MKTFRSFLLLSLFGLLLLTACTATPAFLQPDVASAQSTADNNGSPSLLESVAFNGVVEAVAADSYTVDGLVVRVDDRSQVAANLNVGAAVQVSALLLPDRSRYALSIQPQAAGAVNTAEFKIYGLVQGIADSNWQVSGQTILVDASTQIEAGIALGDWVEVEGRLLNGALSAAKISREDRGAATPVPGQTPGVLPTGYPAPVQTPGGSEVEFYGVVASITGDTWMIAGQTVRTTAATEIKDGATVGDNVKVHATLQADGTYLAREIEKSMGGGSPTETPGGSEVEFYGVVASITGDTWMIAGQTVRTTAATEIKDGATVGDNVKVHATLQADGTYPAREIEIDTDNGGDDNGNDDNGGDDNSGGDDGDDDD